MSAEDWLSLAVVILCLLLSALFSGGERALMAASRGTMRRLQKHGNPRAALVQDLLANPGRMQRALRLGNIAAIVAATAFAGEIFVSWFGGIGAIQAVIAMAVLIILCSEVLPRLVAVVAPDRMALLVATPVGFAVRVLDRAVGAIENLARKLMGLMGFRAGSRERDNNAPETSRQKADLAPAQSETTQLDRDLLNGLLDLSELEVSDIMIHRTEMVMVNADDPPETTVESVLAATVMRLPVWREKPENIVGLLYAKDVMRALQEADNDASKVDIAAIITPPWFVPDTTPLAEQIKAFRRRKTDFALVVDEYGEVKGLVTLEDIIDEIVGDIGDERDIDVPGVRPQIDGSVQCDGTVPIRDLNRAMHWSLPDDAATTIAGLVIHEARSIPEVGQSFTFHGLRFRVVRKSRNRITALRITPLNRRASRTAA